MKKEEMIAEIDAVLGKANIKLVEICGEKKPIEDVVVTYDSADGDEFVLRSGLNEVKRLKLSGISDLKAVKKAIWGIVDATRDEINPEHKDEKKSRKERDAKGSAASFEDVMAKVDEMLFVANGKLQDMTKGEFPFKYSEVVLTVDSDSAGIYIHSGSTPVCAVPRAGNPDAVVRELKAKVFDLVDGTRTAIERRASLKDEAKALKDEGEKIAKATEALRAAGLDTSIIGGDVNPEAKEAVVEAARKAVRKANRNPFIGVVPYHDFKLTVKGFAGGLVVMAGSKPCMVTRFPKVGSNKTVERMVAFIENDIQALSDSRRAYYERISLEAAREERLREIASRIDSADEALRAVAMA